MIADIGYVVAITVSIGIAADIIIFTYAVVVVFNNGMTHSIVSIRIIVIVLSSLVRILS